MSAKICDDTWSVLIMQQITPIHDDTWNILIMQINNPKLKKMGLFRQPRRGHRKFKGPAHMVEGDDNPGDISI